MSQPTPSASQKGNKSADNGQLAPSATKIMETCIFVTDLELSEGQRYVAKRKFIMSIVNSARYSSLTQQSSLGDADSIPDPPHGTKSVWRRKRELEAETLINNAKPLTAIGALQNRIVVLGIEKDKLTVQVKTMKKEQIRLSTEVKRLDKINVFLNRRVETQDTENAAPNQQIEKLKREYARLNTFQAVTIEESHNLKKLLDKQSTRMDTMKQQFDKEQSELQEEIKTLSGLVSSSTCDKLEAQELSSQQTDRSCNDASSQTDDQSIMSAAADTSDKAHSSAEGQLVICRKRLESERQTAVIARNQHISDRTKLTETLRVLQAANDSLTVELNEDRNDRLLLHQTIVKSAGTPSQPSTHRDTQTAANKATINLSAATTYVECRELLEAQRAENTRLTSSNNSLRQELDEANRAKIASESSVLYGKELLLALKDELKKAAELVAVLGADKQVLQSDLDTKTQEHAAETANLKRQLRRDGGMIEKLTQENQECKDPLLKQQGRDRWTSGTEDPSTGQMCAHIVFLVAVMILLIMGFRCLLFCPSVDSVGR